MFAIETDLARSQRKSLAPEAKPDLMRFIGQKAVRFVTGLNVPDRGESIQSRKAPAGQKIFS